MPGELLATAVTRGWRTVFEPKPRAGLNGQQKSFRERDAEIAAARVHEMTGGLMGKPLPDERTVDMEAPNVKRIA